MNKVLEVRALGRRDYRDVLALQRELRLQRLDGSLPNDLLLLVEHEPVYTLGRSTAATSLPGGLDALRATGADLVEIERGGDVTWHGPGQLVGYPIIDLTGHRADLHWYLRTLEAVLIEALGTLAIPAERNPGRTGVWVRGRKIASIGVHVKQWVTLHGFAVNVDPDLRWFEAIVPCGIHGVEMTSVAREAPTAAAGTDLATRATAAVVDAFSAAFACDPQPAYPSSHARAG